MKTPSTDWKEQIADDEKERFIRQAEQIRAVHAAKNTKPDIRGFAVKVLGGTTDHQDFLLINHEAFASSASAPV